MKWIKRLVWLLVLAGIGAFAFIAFQPKPIPVDTSIVSTGTLEVTVNEDGKTRIREKYIVSTPVAGRLQRIDFREGDAVEAGSTLIASIQPSNPNLLDARSLAEAQARVKAAESALERAKSKYSQAELDLEQAKIKKNQAEIDHKPITEQWKRATVLFKQRQPPALSEREYEFVVAEYDSSLENIDSCEKFMLSAKERIRSAGFDKDIANYELELAKAAMVHFQPDDQNTSANGGAAFFPLHSPIDGVVLRVLQESSTIVTPGTPIMELGDADDLEIVVDLLSSDAVKIGPGTKVHIEQWGGDKTLAGVVRLVEPSAFEKISALGVEEQRVNVIIDFDRPNKKVGRIGDGYRVEARLVTWQGNDILKVSTSALFREKNRWAVFVVEDDRAKLTFVEIGHRNDHEAEIIDGLKEGQTVIDHPGDTITDGKLIENRVDGE